MGIAAGTNATIRDLGGVFGVALVGWVFASPIAYAQPRAFVSGYDHALWACVAVGAITAAAVIRLADPRGSSAALGMACGTIGPSLASYR